MSKKKIMMFAIIGVVLIVLGVGGFVAYKMFFSAPEVPPEEQVVEEVVPQAKIGPTLAMSFVVNLADPGRARFLKVNLELELDKEEAKGELEILNPRARDALMMILSSKTTGELLSVADKQKLKNAILHRLNSLLSSGKVVEVYFTEFMVQ